jgi:bla regulator protein blaR1
MNSCMKRLIAVAILPVSGLFAQDLAGIWQGVVKNPDTKEELRTVIKIAPPAIVSPGSSINGNFYSIDQTYLVFPATITVQGSTVKMNIPGIGAVYEAKLSADGNTIAGTVKGFSVPAPWSMSRVTEAEAWPIPKPPAPARPMAADADPAFEVATIKLSNPDVRERGTRIQDSLISIRNQTLAELVRGIYDVHPNQVIGLPAWASSERYDISGKPDVPGQPNGDQLKVMLQKLLADRFQLKFHKEQKELPVFTLSVAKGGAKITRNEAKNETKSGTKNDTSGVIFRAPGSVLLNNLSMDDFCRMLQSSALDRPVVNQTGLAGKYTFSLVWTPEQLVAAAPNPSPLAPAGRADAPPDIYAATQQQLGLKLDGTKLRIEVLVIDRAEKPSEN